MKRTAQAMVLAAAFLGPSAARASCASVTRCFCKNAPIILDARVAAVDGARSTIEVSAAQVGFYASPDAGLPDLRIVPRQEGDAVGRRVLVFTSPQGELTDRLNVEDDGQVSCTKDFRLPAADVIEIALDPNCSQRLYARGLQEPPCNDTGLRCAAGPGVALGGLGTLTVATLLRRRRRRSEAQAHSPRCIRSFTTTS